MKKSLTILSLLGIGIIFLSNSYSVDKPSKVFIEEECSFQAVEMPGTLSYKIKKENAFPMDSNVVQKWIDNSFALNGLETNKDMITHTWGLWQALTEYTEQICNGQRLRRFETWYTPQDVMIATQNNSSLAETRTSTGSLQVRRKFEANEGGFHGAALSVKSGDIVGKVKYNPATAEAVLEGRYFDADVMKAKIKANTISTIEMPVASVLLKPIYRVLTPRLKVYEGIYRFHVWSGKSDGMKEDSEFENYVYVAIDPNDKRIDNKEVFGINKFIHHKMSAAEAEEYNTSNKEGQEYEGNKASAGDIVIVLGSHVSTRETQRWTWQSFYWSPNPDNPVFPSSKTIADGRNRINGLDEATSHYAVSLGYSMLSPAVPLTLAEWRKQDKEPRTDNRGSVYALNPYIEGTFPTETFKNQESLYQTYKLKNLFKPKNIDGITSSCMGCHSQATYIGGYLLEGVNMFVADQYVPRDAPWFIGRLQTDFAWSLSGSFEKHPDDKTKKSAKK